MREAGRRLARILSELSAMVAPGVTTEQLEAHARNRLAELHAEPAFLGYTAKGARGPFPSVLCCSINDELIHAPALPSRPLKSGDIVGLDFGLKYPLSVDPEAKHFDPEAKLLGPRVVERSLASAPYTGSSASVPITNYQLPVISFYVDMAVTVAVGPISSRAQTLLAVTHDALERAIAAVKPGLHLRELARIIQSYVESHGFSIARDYVGHGIGRELHEPPEVPNFISSEFKDVILEEGMTIAIEPMVTMGSPVLTHGPDSWTAKTADGSLAAHFEHTIAVTAHGAEILTLA